MLADRLRRRGRTESVRKATESTVVGARRMLWEADRVMDLLRPSYIVARAPLRRCHAAMSFESLWCGPFGKT